MDSVKKILKNLDIIITGILFTLVVGLTIVNVFFRYFFSTINFGWASETITMLYVWCIFVGAAAVYRSRGHISIEAAMELLPAKIQKAITVFVDIAMLVIFAYVAWLALDYTLNGSVKVMGVLRLSYAYEYAAMPVGFGLMSVYTIPHIIEDFRLLKEGDA
ncbi:TRAP transporter small permease [Butyricicoccus faecihominis]|uniref:TRAP transporter small permease n=1 Tax=Butyricicoccus faecihominis TaxID=1712515 RepID=UPI002479CA4D|nr:TRAP transporter small permease [Butyricicoccus faecihominis]